MCLESFDGENSFTGDVLLDDEVSSDGLVSVEERVEEKRSGFEVVFTTVFETIGEDDDSWCVRFWPTADVGFFEVSSCVCVSAFVELVVRLEERTVFFGMEERNLDDGMREEDRRAWLLVFLTLLSLARCRAEVCGVSPLDERGERVGPGAADTPKLDLLDNPEFTRDGRGSRLLVELDWRLAEVRVLFTMSGFSSDRCLCT